MNTNMLPAARIDKILVVEFSIIIKRHQHYVDISSQLFYLGGKAYLKCRTDDMYSHEVCIYREIRVEFVLSGDNKVKV